MTNNANCPICVGSDLRHLFTESQLISVEDLIESEICCCADCLMIFNRHSEKLALASDYYRSSIFSSSSVFRKPDTESHYGRLNSERSLLILNCLNEIERKAPLVLDVGCADGSFIGAMAGVFPKISQFFGVDPSQDAGVNAPRGVIVETGFAGDSDLMKYNTFDVITLISVLEHIPEPLQILDWIWDRLVLGGSLFVEIPDPLAPSTSLISNFSFEHVTHFTSVFFEYLTLSMGFETRRIYSPNTGALMYQCRKIRAVKAKPFKFEIPKGERERQSGLLADILAAQKVRELHKKALIKKINNFFNSISVDDRPVAMFGFGLHTLELLRQADGFELDYFIDSDPKKQGMTFQGKLCIAPDEISKLGIKTVLISSHRFQEEIQALLESLEIESLKKVFKIYATD